MKNVLKKFCVIALTVIIVFGMAACGNGGGGSGSPSPSPGGSLSGSYVDDEDTVLTFSGSNWTLNNPMFALLGITGDAMRGTYTVSGSTVTCTITWINPDASGGGKSIFDEKVGDKKTLTIIDANTLKEDDITWKKR